MKGSILNSPLLFSASLEAHMSAYADEIKLQSYNEQYQLAQMNIVRECERNNLNQLETILRIEAMNQELKKSLEVSYGDTASPAIPTPVIEEKYSPPMSLTVPSTDKIASTEKALKVISERVRRKKEFKKMSEMKNKEYQDQEKTNKNTKKRLIASSELKALVPKAREYINTRVPLKNSTSHDEYIKKQQTAKKYLTNIGNSAKESIKNIEERTDQKQIPSPTGTDVSETFAPNSWRQKLKVNKKLKESLDSLYNYSVENNVNLKGYDTTNSKNRIIIKRDSDYYLKDNKGVEKKLTSNKINDIFKINKDLLINMRKNSWV